MPAPKDIMPSTIGSLYIFCKVVAATNVLYIFIVGPSNEATPDVGANACVSRSMLW